MASSVEKIKRGIAGYARGEGLAPRPPQRDIYTDIPVGDIDPDSEQPRVDLGDLEELKSSIRQFGLIQPIIVRPVEETRRFVLVVGERRYTATRELGLPTIKAIVRTIDEHERLYLQVIENVQRKDLNALEEAESYQRLMSEFDLTQEEVAAKVGKSQPAVSQTLRVLDLPEAIRAEYKTSYTVPKSLLLEVVRQASGKEQWALWERVKTGEVSVFQARRLRKVSADGPVEDAPPSPPQQKPTQFRFAAKDKTVSGVVTFQSGGADTKDLIQVLQTWVRDLKKGLAAGEQDDHPDGERQQTQNTEQVVKGSER